jgi:hypothetical protein
MSKRLKKEDSHGDWIRRAVFPPIVLNVSDHYEIQLPVFLEVISFELRSLPIS